MAAQNTDLLMEVSISSATTLDSPGYTIGDTSITVVSVSTWPTATGITFAMDEVDAAGVQVAGTYNEYVGVKASATSITNVSHQNGTNQNYTAGATTRVYIPVSAERENRIVEWGLTEHEQDGTHAVELITSRTEDTNPDPDADFLLTYDTSASALKKVKPSNLSGGLTGWTPNVLPSVSSVTNNGNRSYDVTFASTVASYLTPGMRLRTSRTVAAPTQCTDLESGSSQYFSKSSPTNMAQTDDITEMAWIKLESYTGSEMTISSRANGTTDGWRFAIDASGRVLLAGMRAADDYVRSYQSVPLGKWVHVAASIDSSGGTGATYIDGIAVPTEYGNNGNTAFLTPTADFRIGAGTGGTLFFDGKIAQVAHFSAVISAATLRSYMSQGLSGSETSLISAYSFNNSINDLNANANNLTAQGSAVATNADSPFTVDANGVVGGTYDFGIVTKVATTTATVQVPEGCAIPTSGGVSAVDLSSVKSPFGFPADEGRWRVRTLIKVNAVQNSPVNGTWYNAGSTSGVTGGHSLNIPVGAWVHGYETIGYVTRAGSSNGLPVYTTLSTANNTESDTEMTAKTYLAVNSAVDGSMAAPHKKENNLTLSASATYYLNFKVDVASINSVGDLASSSPTIIYVKPAHL